MATTKAMSRRAWLENCAASEDVVGKMQRRQSVEEEVTGTHRFVRFLSVAVVVGCDRRVRSC